MLGAFAHLVRDAGVCLLDDLLEPVSELHGAKSGPGPVGYRARRAVSSAVGGLASSCTSRGDGRIFLFFAKNPISAVPGTAEQSRKFGKGICQLSSDWLDQSDRGSFASRPVNSVKSLGQFHASRRGTRHSPTGAYSHECDELYGTRADQPNAVSPEASERLDARGQPLRPRKSGEGGTPGENAEVRCEREMWTSTRHARISIGDWYPKRRVARHR